MGNPPQTSDGVKPVLQPGGAVTSIMARPPLPPPPQSEEPIRMGGGSLVPLAALICALAFGLVAGAVVIISG